jgi:N-acetylornithine carbamoyltransferase
MATRMGLDVTLAHPEGFDLDATVVRLARREAAEAGGRFEVVHDQREALTGADFVYAKSWGGLERYAAPDTEAVRRARFDDWRVTTARMERTHHAGFMHCLPVRRGVVCEDAVLDDPHALHLEQAAYRLHGQKAIIEWFWQQADKERIP